MDAVDPAAARAFLQTAIPMYGRMIHKQTGELDSQLYDRDGQVSTGFYAVHLFLTHMFFQCINSIDRSLLNEELLQQVSRCSNARVFFNYKVISADFDKKSITIRDSSSHKEFPIQFDFCIGADGSYSIIRRQMMRVVRYYYNPSKSAIAPLTSASSQNGLSTGVH